MTPRRDTLLLITGSPLGRSVTESAFLGPELGLLRERFGRIVVASLSERPSMLRRLGYSLSGVALRAAALEARRGVRAAMRANSYGANSAYWRDRIEALIRSGEIDPRRTVVYTFWLDMATTGAALLAERYGLKIVSRAHGYDIRQNLSPWLRSLTLERIEALAAACDYSRRMLCRATPAQASKITTAYLGTPRPAALAPAAQPWSEQQPLELATAARLVEIKRLDRAADLAIALARLRPRLRVRWTLFGGGDPAVQRSLTARIEQAACPNLEVDWRGEVANGEVLAHYASAPVHWVVLTSADEGGVPISLCEAMSRGIPAVATAVGGVTEIVESGVNGLAVGAEQFDASALAAEVAAVSESAERYGAFRRRACEIWSERFDAAKLRPQFVTAYLNPLIP